VSLLRAFINFLEHLAEGTHWDEAIAEFFSDLGVLGIRKWCDGDLERETGVTPRLPQDRADWAEIEMRLTDDIIYSRQ